MATVNGKIVLSHSETLKEQLDSISECLRDFRTTTLSGKTARDLGLLCTSPNINEKALMKPYRSPMPVTTFEDRARAKFGWDTNNKAAGEPMSSYLDRLKANGVNKNYWSYLPPRGKEYNEMLRVWDFDGYYNNEKGFGEKAVIQKFDKKDISLKGNSQTITLSKNANTRGSYESSLLQIYSKVVIQVAVEKVSPFDTSLYNWDVDGTFTISVVSDNGVVKASETWDIYSDGNGVPSKLFTFRYDTTSANNCKIVYTWNIDNRSNFYNGQDQEYFDIELKTTTEDCYTLAQLSNGREGLSYRDASSWDYDVLNAMFGSNELLLVVELTDGVSTERKMGTGKNIFLFEKAGFSTSMMQSFTTMYLYALRGDNNSIFSITSPDLDYYGDISLADNYEIIPHQFSFKDATYMAPVIEMEFFAGDFAYANYAFQDGTTQTVTVLNKNGIACTKQEEVSNITFGQYITFENVPEATDVMMRIEIYNGGEDYQDGVGSQTLTIPEGSGTYLFEVFSHTASSHPQSLQIRVLLYVEGETYYLDIYNQEITSVKTPLYNLGI